MQVWASWLRTPVAGVVHVDVAGGVGLAGTGEVGGMVGVVLMLSLIL